MRTRICALLFVAIISTHVNSHLKTVAPSRTVDLIKELKPSLDTEIAALHAKYIDKWSVAYGVPREEVVALTFQESEFNSCAVSNKGAIGAMQVLPRAHKDKLRERRLMASEVFSLDNNYSLGCEIFSKERKHGLTVALRHYVGGHEPRYVEDIKRNISRCRRI